MLVAVIKRSRRCRRRASGRLRRSLPSSQQDVESREVQVAPARHQVAEALPALGIERHDLAIEDRLGPAQLRADPVCQLGEAVEQGALLRSEIGSVLTAEVEQAAKAVVLGLEQVGRVVERPVLEHRRDRDHLGQDLPPPEPHFLA